jgi:NAD(P)-dependent dehydrogenase (short-subunit alcohol dehydrogenase family)
MSKPTPPQRIALVTGANRGIGREIARQLAMTGAMSVIIGARDRQKGADTVADFARDGIRAATVTLDTSNSDSILHAVGQIEREHGAIDILVNNAAIMIDGPGGFDASLFDLTSDTMRRTFETNVLGPVALMQTVLPGMKARGYGRVVNVSSLAGQLQDMGAGFPAYRMSKAALNAATRIAAAEIGAGNVKINAASPGWVRTGMGGPDAPRTVEKGAETAVFLALLPGDGPSGGFFHDKSPVAW